MKVSKGFAVAVLAASITGCYGNGALPRSQSVVEVPAVSISGNLYVSNRPAPNGYGSSQLTCPTWISVYQSNTPTLVDKLPGLCKGTDGSGAVAFDDEGNLYWADHFNGAVLVFAPGQTKPSRTISWGAPSPYSIAVAPNGTLYVANLGPFNVGYGASSISVYAPGKSAPSYSIVDGISSPIYITVDAAGTLYVANCPGCELPYYGLSQTGSVSEYAPGEKDPSRIVYAGAVMPFALAVDSDGTLYVANHNCRFNTCGQGSVAEYARGQVTPALTVTQGLSDPTSVAIDGTGTLYVASNNVLEAFPKGRSSPSFTVQSPSHCGAQAVTTDASNNFYVLQTCSSEGAAPNGAVAVYHAGQTTPAYTITEGIDDPKNSLAIAP